MKLTTHSKLTLFFSALFAGLLAITFMILSFRINKSLYRDFQSEMVHDGRIMAELFKEELKLNDLEEFQEEIKEFGINLYVLDAHQNILVKSEEWDRLGIAIDDALLGQIKESPVFKEILINQQHVMLFSRLVHVPTKGTYSLHMVRSMENFKRIKEKIIFWMAVIFPFMIVVSAFLGSIFSSRTLKVEQQAFDQLKKFSADASHELRAPLTALRGNLEVALRKERSIPEYREVLQEALEETENLSRLTQDLLLLAQTDSGKISLNIQKVPLQPFLDRVYAQSQSLENPHQVKLLFPPQVMGEAVFDPERINQLLINLIDNAFKYGRKGGTAQLQIKNDGEFMRISLEDNGQGIPEEDLGKIFDRFYRVDKARSRETGGTGLGLSIVDWVARAHGGNVQVKSQLGKGSIFTVTLPAQGLR
ncbi:MAG: Adaptive-response sensory-kinase SasA [Elusimicrobia bacterium]|nr:Adaptive-response sensory-kinase SasA [Elusimicrobiota bacterium]